MTRVISRCCEGPDVTALQTDRRSVLAASGTALTAGLFAVSSDGESSEPSWPMERYDAAGTGHAPDATGPETGARVRWKHEIYGLVFAPPSPTLHEGTLYYSAADRFLAVDADAGTVRHEVENGTYLSSPTVVTDTAYANETLAVADRAGLAGVNPAGGVDVFGHRYRWSNRWTYPDRDRDDPLFTFGSETSPAPVVTDDALVYAGSVGGENAVAVLDPSSAAERWRVELRGELRRPAVHDGTVYVASWGGGVRALALDDGSEPWRTRTDQETVHGLAVSDGRVVVTDWENAYAFDATTGSRLWRRAFDAQIRSPPAIADDTLLVTSEKTEGRLYALDAATGETRWTFGDGNWDSSPVVAGGVVYHPSHHDLFALDLGTGERLWRFASEGSVSTPAVADGRVYVAGGHVLYALEESR